tara:strand:- start:6093 stop:6470 length:378 start_codon:yes stop_codon:yes gene_type:complete
MFILKKEATFTHPIVFYTPSDGGTQKEETFDAIFKIISQSRINEIGIQAQKKQKELDEGIFDGVKISDYMIADEILVGWDGITDTEKNPIPFTKATKKQLLDIPGLANLLVTKYFEEVSKQKVKN